MSVIELDLVPPRVDQLSSLYAGETPEQHTARMQRYTEAFARYDKRHEAYIRDVMSQIHNDSRKERMSAEQKAREQDIQQGEELLSQIASA